MSLEYFRPECQRPLDADGFEVDCCTREIAEIESFFRATEPFEPTDADWDEMARWCEWADRNDEMRMAADAEFEARQRFG